MYAFYQPSLKILTITTAITTTLPSKTLGFTLVLQLLSQHSKNHYINSIQACTNFTATLYFALRVWSTACMLSSALNIQTLSYRVYKLVGLHNDSLGILSSNWGVDYHQKPTIIYSTTWRRRRPSCQSCQNALSLR